MVATSKAAATVCLTIFSMFASGCACDAAAEAALPGRVYAQAATLPLDAPFVAALQRTASFDLHRLTREEVLGLDLAQLAAKPSVRLQDAAKIAAIKALLLAPETYSPSPEFQSSCPFFPNLALRFLTPEGRPLWLLIAQGCESVRYAPESADWRRTTRILNVTSGAMTALAAQLQ